MQLYTSVLGSNGDLYVGGTFESRVWTGSHFADVYHAARFDGAVNRASPRSGRYNQFVYTVCLLFTVQHAPQRGCPWWMASSFVWTEVQRGT
jgi:hypothetical protein